MSKQPRNLNAVFGRLRRRMLAAELSTEASEPARRTMPATPQDPPPRLPARALGEYVPGGRVDAMRRLLRGPLKSSGRGAAGLPSGTVVPTPPPTPEKLPWLRTPRRPHRPRSVRDCDPPAPPSTRVHARPEPGPMTAAWGYCPAPRHPGELLTRSDVCHVHADRAAAERCGVLLGGAPELVRLDKVRPAVYRVAWSLSSVASGRLRRRPPV